MVSDVLSEAQARDYVHRIANLCRRYVSHADEFDDDPSVVHEDVDGLERLLTEYFTALAGGVPTRITETQHHVEALTAGILAYTKSRRARCAAELEALRKLQIAVAQALEWQE
jgi:hypothetical protein